MRAPAILSTERLTVRPYRPEDREAIMGIEAKRHAEWREKGVDIPLGDPADSTWVAAVVVEDEEGRVVGALGARMVAELGSTIDKDAMTMHEMRDVLMRAWAKVAWQLFAKGFKEAMCRVTSPTPGWARMLEKRAKFMRSKAPHFYFDLEAAFTPSTDANS